MRIYLNGNKIYVTNRHHDKSDIRILAPKPYLYDLYRHLAPAAFSRNPPLLVESFSEVTVITIHVLTGVISRNTAVSSLCLSLEKRSIRPAASRQHVVLKARRNMTVELEVRKLP